VICELARKNPKNYISYAPQFFKIITNCTNNWILIKLVKLVCVCVCVCVCVYVCVCVGVVYVYGSVGIVPMIAYLFTHYTPHTHTHKYIHKHTHANTNAHTHAHTLQKHTHTHTKRTRIHPHTYVHTHTHKHTYTHIHMYTRGQRLTTSHTRTKKSQINLYILGVIYIIFVNTLGVMATLLSCYVVTVTIYHTFRRAGIWKDTKQQTQQPHTYTQHTHIHTNTHHAPTHTCIDIYIYKHTHPLYVNIDRDTHIHTHTYIHDTHIRACTDRRIISKQHPPHIHTYIHIRTHTHTHTHTHTMFEKTLTALVKGLRHHKSSTAYVNKCLQEIKTELRSPYQHVKAEAVRKLIVVCALCVLCE